MHFVDLAVDVVYSIFSFCDISTVLSVGQTCRHFHQLSRDKSVWLALVDDLRRRSILDHISTSNCAELSTDGVINLLKHITHGPATWRPHIRPKILKKVTLKTNMVIGIGGVNKAKLLPSGRHVLFNDGTTLQCWDATSDGLIWTYQPLAVNTQILEFAAEEIEGGNSVRVMICEYIDHSGGESWVQIIEVDLSKGNHRLLLTIRTPDRNNSHDPFYAPDICGRRAIVAMDFRQANYFVIDWKLGCAFVLECDLIRGAKRPSQLALIPGHLVLKTLSFDRKDTIHLIPNASLDPHWFPAAEFNGGDGYHYVRDYHLPKRSTLSASQPDTWKRIARMSVHESPLRHGEYRVWLQGTTDDPPEGSFTPAKLWCYRLSLQYNQPPQWRREMPGTAWGECAYPHITFSGHTLVRRSSRGRRHWVIPSGLTPENDEVELRSCAKEAHLSGCINGDSVDMAAYSGVVTYCTLTSIIILYFR
ncbi:hypothetical protein C8R43DRAFT_674958 [Mycena crocata]|nr:hypothetical protein C8R43DRAFT_674958 [Mycena crocata]